MNSADFERALREGRWGELTEAIAELAWIRARHALGLGPNDPPYSRHDDTVTEAHRNAYGTELVLITRAASDAMTELMESGWPTPDNVTPIRPENR